jgi:hypothetical protein
MKTAKWGALAEYGHVALYSSPASGTTFARCAAGSSKRSERPSAQVGARCRGVCGHKLVRGGELFEQIEVSGSRRLLLRVQRLLNALLLGIAEQLQRAQRELSLTSGP